MKPTFMTMRTAALLWILVMGPSPAAAQRSPSPRPASVAASLARADAAFARGDEAEAEKEYRAVLAADPDRSRALFQLAELHRDDPSTAVELLERYVVLEPSDAWGHLALAEAAAGLGRDADALRALDAAFALEPSDRDIALGRPRVLARLGRLDAAIEAYEAWLASHRDDAQAWRELADQQQRAGYARSAARAVEEILRLTPGDPALERRRRALEFRRAPAVELGILGTAETDIGTTGLAAAGDFGAGDRWRLAVGFDARRFGSFGDVAQSRRLTARVRLRPRADLQVDLSGGPVWMIPPLAASRVQTELGARVRRNTFANGVRLDVRARRGPLDVSPGLIDLGLMRSQIQTMVEVPAAENVRLRGLARVGALTRADEKNIRTGWSGGGVIVLAPGMQLATMWHRLANSETAALGYFAPKRAEQVDAGLELEAERGDVAISLDAGAGLQRFQKEEGGPMGGWGPALRLWGLIAWSYQPGQQLRVEIESYDSRVTDAIALTERWRYTSVAATVRVGLPPQTR